MDPSLRRQAELHLAYLARAGVRWKVDGEQLLLHPVEVLTELDLATIRIPPGRRRRLHQAQRPAAAHTHAARPGSRR